MSGSGRAATRDRATAWLLSTPGLEHDRAQAALAASFSSTAISSPEALLDEASLPLFGAEGLDVPEQSEALADLLTHQLCLSPDRRDHRALLIDHALTQRSAHPLQIAVIGHELARRAGIPSFVGVFEGEPWTVLRGDAGMALVGPSLVGSRPSAVTIRHRCAHQVAHAVLSAIGTMAPPEPARRAERLLRSVPVSGGC